MNSPSKKRVVVVDDSPTSLRCASDALLEAGFDVQGASDGEEAISMITQNPPDVVVLDIILPKKNGFQVCRELKTNAATRDVKIVLLSSKSQESDRFWGQRQGADAYLTKPFDRNELTAIVLAIALDGNHSDNIEPAAATTDCAVANEVTQ